MAKRKRRTIKRSLMTIAECERRYRREPTARNALVLGLERWTRLGPLRHWETLRDISNKAEYLSGCGCALCLRYRDGEWSCSTKGHGICPLADTVRISIRIGCQKDSPWDRAVSGVKSRYRPAFIRARRNLLARMRRALARMDREGEVR